VVIREGGGGGREELVEEREVGDRQDAFACISCTARRLKSERQRNRNGFASRIVLENIQKSKNMLEDACL